MVMDVNWIYCGDHFEIHTNIESLHCTPEMNTMLCQLYLNTKILFLELHICAKPNFLHTSNKTT